MVPSPHPMSTTRSDPTSSRISAIRLHSWWKTCTSAVRPILVSGSCECSLAIRSQNSCQLDSLDKVAHQSSHPVHRCLSHVRVCREVEEPTTCLFRSIERNAESEGAPEPRIVVDRPRISRWDYLESMTEHVAGESIAVNRFHEDGQPKECSLRPAEQWLDIEP